LKTVFVAIGLAVVINVAVAVALGTPMRFIIASFLAILFSELTDTAVYQRLINRSWLTRALTSNAISIPLDSLLFTIVAFYGIMSNAEMAQIIWADILFKTLIAGGIAFLLMNSAKRFSPAAAV
jgi:hypothetical protein